MIVFFLTRPQQQSLVLEIIGKIIKYKINMYLSKICGINFNIKIYLMNNTLKSFFLYMA